MHRFVFYQAGVVVELQTTMFWLGFTCIVLLTVSCIRSLLEPLLWVLCLWCSVSNVYKVVQSRNGSILRALAMVILCSIMTLNSAFKICLTHLVCLLTALPLCGTLGRSACLVWVTLCYLFSCLISFLIFAFMFVFSPLCRDYLSPAEIIRKYPHFVVLGTGLAFGFLVVGYNYLSFSFQFSYLFWISDLIFIIVSQDFM